MEFACPYEQHFLEVIAADSVGLAKGCFERSHVDSTCLITETCAPCVAVWYPVDGPSS